jgi:hypothetical protein
MRASEITNDLCSGKLNMAGAYIALVTELQIKEQALEDFYSNTLLPAANIALEESMKNADGGDYRYEQAFQDGVNHILDLMWNACVERKD